MLQAPAPFYVGFCRRGRTGAVDVKKRADNTGWNVYVEGGRKDTGIDCMEWILKGVSLGAGEILLTSMDADGTKDGFDLDLYRELFLKL